MLEGKVYVWQPGYIQAVRQTLAEGTERLKTFSYCYYLKIHYAMKEFMGKDMNYLVR